MRAIITVTILLASWASALPVLAQEDVRDRSLELNEAGFEAFEQGRFDDAAGLFSRAYDLVPDPALRKNEAVAWFKAKRCDAAISAANKLLLLEDAPEPDRAEVRTIIANCKVEFARDALETGSIGVAREFLAEAEALASDQHVVDQIKVVRLEIARRENVDEAVDDPAPKPETTVTQRKSAPARPGWKDAPAWQWSVLGAGGAMAIGGLVLHAVALGWQSRFLEMARSGGDPAEFDALRRRVHTARVAVPVLYGLGAVGVGAGTTMIFVLPSLEHDVAHRRVRAGFRFAAQF